MLRIAIDFMAMEPPSASQTVTERKIAMVPSVTMNGSILPMVMIAPFSSPASAPTPRATTTPAASIAVSPSIAPELRNRIMILATSAAIDPTDRSSPPAEMTNVAPTAMMAMNEERVRTLSRLSTDRKLGLTSAPRRNSAASARNGATAVLLRNPRSFRGQNRACRQLFSYRSCVPRTVKFCFVDFDAGGVDDDFVLGHRLAHHFADDARRAHDKDAMADADEFLHFGGNDDHRLARLGEAGDEFVDLFLGPDIDAACRFVDDDDARLKKHHLGKEQFLLVAAGKLPGQKIAASGADHEIANGLVEALVLALALDQRALCELAECCQRQVGAQVLRQPQPFSLAVLAPGRQCLPPCCRAHHGT